MQASGLYTVAYGRTYSVSSYSLVRGTLAYGRTYSLSSYSLVRGETIALAYGRTY